MKKILFLATVLVVLAGTLWFSVNREGTKKWFAQVETPPVVDALIPEPLDDPLGLINWKRPDGPLRVGIQAGHWKYTEAPDEIEGVRNNGGGTSASGVPEWEVNLAVAEKIAEQLRQKGVEVDVLPATVPPGYWADAFVALHADGNVATSVTGYKVAAARRDITGKAEELSRLIEEKYGPATNLPLDPNITRTMRGYYAFSWHRYEHAIHPMVPGVIVEMGFLSNSRDARLLINSPELPATAIAEAVLAFLGLPADSEALNEG